MDEKDLIAAKKDLLAAIGCPAERVAKLNSLDAINALIDDYKERQNAKTEEPEMASKDEIKKKDEADKAVKKNTHFLRPSQANIPIPEEKPVPENDQTPQIDEHFNSISTRNATRYNSAARVLRLYTAEFPEGRVF